MTSNSVKTAILLYNPSAGDGRITANLDTVIQMCQNNGYILDVLRLDGTVDLKEHLNRYEKPKDMVLIAGGDGTANIVVNALQDLGWESQIGILPVGTANDYSTYIGMPQNVTEAMRQILTLPPQRMDLCKAGNQYFINVFSMGYFTDISQKTDTGNKNYMGKLAYYLKSFELLKEIKAVKVKVETENYTYDGDAYLVMVFNGISAGGNKIAKKSVGNDGLMDIIILKSNLDKIVPAIVKFIKGEALNEHEENTVAYIQAPWVSLSSEEPVPTDADGEKGAQLPVRIECINRKIGVLGITASI